MQARGRRSHTGGGSAPAAPAATAAITQRGNDQRVRGPPVMRVNRPCARTYDVEDQPKKKSRENSRFGKRDIIARAGCPRAMNNVNPGTI